jgi:glutathione S-transferase
MVKLILYGNKLATCTQCVLILLEELNLKYELREIDLMKGQQKDQRYLQLQPFGKVPVVIYGDHKLFESRSILRYIAKNNTEDIDLTLNDSPYVDMWLEVESQNFNPPISKFIYEKVFKKWKNSEAIIDEAVLNSALEDLGKVFDVYESRLSLDDTTQGTIKPKYIGGNSFSIADISHIPYLYMFVTSGPEYKTFLKKYPHVYKWYKRMLMKDSVKEILDTNDTV